MKLNDKHRTNDLIVFDSGLYLCWRHIVEMLTIILLHTFVCWCWFQNSSGSFCLVNVIELPTVDIVVRSSLILYFQSLLNFRVLSENNRCSSPRLSVRQSIYLPVCLSACPSVRLSAHPSVRTFFLSACLAGFYFWFGKEQHMRWQQIEQAREKTKTIIYYENEQNIQKPNEKSHKTNVNTKLMVLKNRTKTQQTYYKGNPPQNNPRNDDWLCATYLLLLFGSSHCVVRWWFWWLLWCGCFSLNNLVSRIFHAFPD